MFENEIKDLKKRITNSHELIEKLQEINKPYEYGAERRKDIFYLDIRIPRSETVENQASEYLNSLIRKYGLQPINGKATAGTIPQRMEELQKLTIKDFFFSLVKYIPYNYKTYELKEMYLKMEYMHKTSVFLILNCLWLLDNDQPITDFELENKLYKLAESGNSFIFKSCKVTSYKNSNLKIQFSNATMFEKFEKIFKEALKLAEDEKAKKSAE